MSPLHNVPVENPKNSIEERVKSMGEKFYAAYTMPCNNNPASQASFAQLRLQIATMLYYKVLENIMLTEQRRFRSKIVNNSSKPVDLTVLFL